VLVAAVVGFQLAPAALLAVKIRTPKEVLDEARSGTDEKREARTKDEGPLAEYVEAVRLIHRASALRDEGKTDDAMSSYRAALRILERLEMRFPTWNVQLREYRQRQCQQIVATVSQKRAGTLITIRDEVDTEAPKGPKIISRGPRRAEEEAEATAAAAPDRPEPSASEAPVWREVAAAPEESGAAAATRPSEAPAAVAGQPAPESPGPGSEMSALETYLEEVIRERDSLKSRNAVLERELESAESQRQAVEQELTAARAQAPAAATSAGAPAPATPSPSEAEADQRLAVAQALQMRLQGQKEREIATLRASLAKAISRLRELDPAAADALEASTRPAPPAP